MIMLKSTHLKEMSYLLDRMNMLKDDLNRTSECLYMYKGYLRNSTEENQRLLNILNSVPGLNWEAQRNKFKFPAELDGINLIKKP